MNAQQEIEPPTLAKLREPFPAHCISKLPKETGAQAKQRKAAQDAGNWPNKCEVCGGYHHHKAVHLDYVGHAALTDRLLDTDPEWSWEPVAFGPDGLPMLDRNGGLWIRLTVLGVTRLGYGDADGKTGGNAIKEAIGDALRNAAMRFGAALDLWHKGDLHAPDVDDEPCEENKAQEPQPKKPTAEEMPAKAFAKLQQLAEATGTTSQALCKKYNTDNLRNLPRALYDDCITFLEDRLAAKVKGQTNAQGFGEILDDEIPEFAR